LKKGLSGEEEGERKRCRFAETYVQHRRFAARCEACSICLKDFCEQTDSFVALLGFVGLMFVAPRDLFPFTDFILLFTDIVLVLVFFLYALVFKLPIELPFKMPKYAAPLPICTIRNRVNPPGQIRRHSLSRNLDKKTTPSMAVKSG
jgi:hypothetical protein